MIYEWTLDWYVSPHEVARQFGHEEVFRLLTERSPANLKLIATCWASDESTVKSLLQEHPKLVAGLSADYSGHAARAARNNNLPAVRLMLVAGLSVDALGQHRATPLHWAAFQGNAEMAEEILRYHPSLELIDADYKSTPSRLGHLRLGKWLALRPERLCPDRRVDPAGRCKTSVNDQRHGCG